MLVYLVQSSIHVQSPHHTQFRRRNRRSTVFGTTLFQTVGVVRRGGCLPAVQNNTIALGQLQVYVNQEESRKALTLAWGVLPPPPPASSVNGGDVDPAVHGCAQPLHQAPT